MDVQNIITAALILGGLGLLFGIILGIASKIFEVHKDERIAKIMEVLPCANCGGCGFAGCSAFAEAVVTGKVSPGGCSVGGAECSSKVSSIMGLEDTGFEKKTARILCNGTCDMAPLKYQYDGIDSCTAALKVAGGPKECAYGCLGIGSCAQVCPQKAIKIENGIAVVNESKCVGCGRCVNVCPRRLIRATPNLPEYTVICRSKDKGPQVNNVCKTGCIGCGICVKNCPSEAIVLEDNIAKIDPDKCTNCGICSEKCPKKIIKKF